MKTSKMIVDLIKKNRLQTVLNISDQFETLLVLAIGKPKEEIVIEEVGEDGNIRYWRDSNAVHHVPKRSLDDIIINCY